MRRARIPHAALLALALALAAPPALAGSFTETFDTKQFCDQTLTTALWDTIAGEVRLPPFDMDEIGGLAIPGVTRDVQVVGNVAYVANSMFGLMILDVSDPESPSLLGIADPSFDGYAVAVEGNLAYVAAGPDGLQVLDVSDPNLPVVVGSLAAPGYALDIAVAGDTAYLAGGTAGLVSVDVSEPEDPLLLDTDTSAYNAQSVAVSGDIAYVSDYQAGTSEVVVYDVSAPAMLNSVGYVSGLFYAYGVAVSGDLLLAVDTAGGLMIYDISSPAVPVLIGVAGTATGSDLSVDGRWVYVAGNNDDLFLVDILDPTTPVVRRNLSLPGAAVGTCPAGEHVYVAAYSDGLRVVESRTVSDMRPLGYTDIGYQDARDVVIAGERVYLACPNTGLWSGDIGDPENPWGVSPAWPDIYPYGVAHAGDHVFLTGQVRTLTVYDVTTPASPVLAGPELGIGWGRCIEVAGNHAFIGGAIDGGTWGDLWVYDITDPAAPTLEADVPIGTRIVDLAVEGNYVHAAVNGVGLATFWTGDPAFPSLYGTTPTSATVNDLAIAGDLLATADSAGVHVYDITVPHSPTLIGSFESRGAASNLVLTGNLCLASCEGPLLVLLDLGNPAAPVELAAVTQARGHRMALSGDYLYKAHNSFGVYEAFNHFFDTTRNLAASLTVASWEDDQSQLRITTTGSGTLQGWVTLDGVNPGPLFDPDGWNDIPVPVDDLRFWLWLTPDPADPETSPVCDELTLDWRFAGGEILSVTDVPGDQGGAVRIRYAGSIYDPPESGDPVTAYNVWQRVDDPLLKADVRAGGRTDATLPGLPLLTWRDRRFADATAGDKSSAFPPGLWEIVGGFAAAQMEEYLYRATTLADSSSAGVPWSVYVLTAHRNSPPQWYATLPDSGYSVDNIPPSVPTGFTVAYTAGGNALAWDACPDGDFRYFRIFRGDDPGFAADEAHLVHETIAASWQDGDGDYDHHYQVSAVDFGDNESGPAAPGSTTGAGVPRRLAMAQNTPNPFNPSTVIRFALPAGARARLTVFGVDGRLVATLVDETLPPGPHVARWDGRDDRGRVLASGTYFYRLDCGGEWLTRRMMLVR